MIELNAFLFFLSQLEQALNRKGFTVSYIFLNANDGVTSCLRIVMKEGIGGHLKHITKDFNADEIIGMMGRPLSKVLPRILGK